MYYLKMAQCFYFFFNLKMFSTKIFTLTGNSSQKSQWLTSEQYESPKQLQTVHLHFISSQTDLKRNCENEKARDYSFVMLEKGLFQFS